MEIKIEKNIMIPMKDHVKLAADVYRPCVEKALPVLLRRLPYDKERPKFFDRPDILRLVQAGFIVVVQDVRGTGASEGEFLPINQEAEDGEDTINWIAAQSWCDGNIGMIGGSYHGMTQILAAKRKPAALKAIAPHLTPSDFYEDLAYRGGALELGGTLSWTTRMFFTVIVKRALEQGKEMPKEFIEFLQSGKSYPFNVEKLPLLESAEFNEYWPVYKEWLTHSVKDDYWKSSSFREFYHDISVPALHTAGWYDIFLRGTLKNFQGIKQRSSSEIAKKNQRLIIGPWTHTNNTGTFAEHEYGMKAGLDGIDHTGLLIEWFNKWLKGIDNQTKEEKPVKLFVMGINEWRDEEDWPLPDTKYRPYYLHSNGNANRANGDGVLSAAEPKNEPSDVYLYNPKRPVPTRGGNIHFANEHISGPLDQSSVEDRDDVLCYTSEPLLEATEVTGPIELILYISSSAKDTDFTGKLVDVHPDGRAEILTEGILRVRYRHSFDSPELMEQGTIYKIKIEMAATSNVFKVGHRIRLEVSSSNFPKYDRNSNSGGSISSESEESFITAVNQVHHNESYKSHILLPIIEREK
ncbi:CocE/NonD family hydrolase [Bacillus sp. Marseille-P3661]|uniref:CocE/NonD family hydrolase n=1 Tax=Bacillus sp. Marseille-P3661 TaxID=1936234 RepID=UPI000C84EFF1|nr:CocE/NonD family hydrolase [Bacillus sp. Marseille-P3661]